MYSNLPKLVCVYVCVCIYIYMYIYIYIKCTTRSLSSKSKIHLAKFMDLTIFLPSDLMAEISPNPATN